jgi:cation diffusion facilitator family transporter
MFSTPRGAARLMLVTVVGLFVFKVAVGLLTGSVSIWAQAADSSLDIFAVIVTFLTVGFSAKPADREHPFGHGKVEDVAALVQALLLVAAVVAIDYAAVQRIIHGQTIQVSEAGIAVMLVSMVTSIFLSRHLFRVARKTGSIALEANANNIRGDIYSTGGVLAALTVVRIGAAFNMDLDILDPIIALVVSVLILRAAFSVGRMAFAGLVDVRLPKEEEDLILSLINEHIGQVVGVHRVRTRRSGSQRHIDLHLVMPRGASVEEAHEMCDHLEQDIQAKLPRSNVTIHVEPCDVTCAQCAVLGCDLRFRDARGGA